MKANAISNNDEWQKKEEKMNKKKNKERTAAQLRILEHVRKFCEDYNIVDSITFMKDDIVRGAYLGEYLDNARKVITDIETIEDIAGILTMTKKWTEEEAVNYDQKARLLVWMDSVKENSITMKIDLYKMYKLDSASSKPYLKPEAYSRKMEELCFELTECNDINEIANIVDKLPFMAEKFKKHLNDFFEKGKGERGNVFEDDYLLETLLAASLHPKWNYKNKHLSKMKKLMLGNVKKGSKCHEDLCQYFTDREMKYLNCRFLRYDLADLCKNASLNQSAVEFIENLICSDDEMDFTKEEKDLIDFFNEMEFERKISGYSSIREIFIEDAGSIMRFNPGKCITENQNNWETMYHFRNRCEEDDETKKAWSITKGDYLFFDITLEKNRGRWECLTKKQKVDMIEHTLVADKTKRKVEPQYVDKKAYELLCEIIVENEILDELDEKGKYNTITRLVQTGLIQEPQKTTRWIQAKTILLNEPYFIEFLIEFCHKQNIVPMWIQIQKEKDFFEIITKESILGLPENSRFELFDILFDVFYYNAPTECVETMMRLYMYDVTEKKCMFTGSEILLRNYMPLEEIRKYAKFLLDSGMGKEYEEYFRSYSMDEKDFLDWKKDEDKKKQEHEDMEELLEFQGILKCLMADYIGSDNGYKFLSPISLPYHRKNPHLKKAIELDILISIIVKHENERFDNESDIERYTAAIAKIATYTQDREIICSMARKILEKREV